MKFIPNAVTAKVARQVLVAQKHSPTILLASGVTGVVTSAVLACKATLRLEEVLNETEKNLSLAQEMVHENYSEKDRQHDLVLIRVQSAAKIAKLYMPAVVVGTVSIAAIVGSHRILSRRNAALTAAYAVLEKGFAEYRQRVVAEYGEDKDREMMYGTADYITTDAKGNQKTVRGPAKASVYARFFDQLNKHWEPTPEYNLTFLECQQNFINDRLRARGHVFLNEVYDLLGIERSQAGAVVGWIKGEGSDYIDFGIFRGDNQARRDFVNGFEDSILLDFNVQGVIWDKI